MSDPRARGRLGLGVVTALLPHSSSSGSSMGRRSGPATRITFSGPRRAFGTSPSPRSTGCSSDADAAAERGRTRSALATRSLDVGEPDARVRRLLLCGGQLREPARPVCLWQPVLRVAHPRLRRGSPPCWRVPRSSRSSGGAPASPAHLAVGSSDLLGLSASCSSGGTGLVPNRGPVDFRVATRNQVTWVPGLLVDFPRSLPHGPRTSRR